MTSKQAALTVITGNQVAEILKNSEGDVLQIVRATYIDHAHGKSSLPYSVFLRFPDKPSARIIGLPAYAGGKSPVAGMKWIASFPDNIHHGMERASATIILNSPDTGQPYSLLEGSAISAQRTAASAVLAATVLQGARQSGSLSLIGCGLINAEVLRFSRFVFKDLTAIHIFDHDSKRAEQFAQRMAQERSSIHIHNNLEEALQASPLVSFATTASAPHVLEPGMFQDGATVLHVSLRDISPGIISQSVNVVDDLDHVNRESTSIHLTAQELGNTDFVTATLGELLAGIKTLPAPSSKPIVFSPFGLGILDMRLAAYVHSRATATDGGHIIPDFLPRPWVDRA